MVHQDTALLWMLKSGRYFFHSSLATAGKAGVKFDAVAIDMCASLAPAFHRSTRACVDGSFVSSSGTSVLCIACASFALSCLL